MSDRVQAEVFPPSEYIRSEIEERNWTELDLAERLGVSVGVIAEILSDQRRISPEAAHGLGQAFGTSAQTWLDLDWRYHLNAAASRPGRKLPA
jgi:HTH-type transcriptional regulator/antitoxin HigA